MAESRAEGDGYVLIENHCPICVAATACQGFCRSELDTFREVLGPDVSVERIEHIVEWGPAVRLPDFTRRPSTCKACTENGTAEMIEYRPVRREGAESRRPGLGDPAQAAVEGPQGRGRQDQGDRGIDDDPEQGPGRVIVGQGWARAPPGE